MKKTILILHDIRSNHNVGSLFRTADCVGINEIILSGYTPTPIDRFNRPVKEIAKTALGAEKSVSWRHEKDIKKVLTKLKKEKYTIIAIEQAKNSVDYKKVKVKGNTAIILWNEVEGAPNNLLKMCDVVAEIPMKGKKESLNVSVAGAVALFRMLGV
jgi:tRNA G18 (ribose-2'-O)-methylase SpoU